MQRTHSTHSTRSARSAHSARLGLNFDPIGYLCPLFALLTIAQKRFGKMFPDMPLVLCGTICSGPPHSHSGMLWWHAPVLRYVRRVAVTSS
eukprot:COSAG01_NODE_552_length_15569_cov_37.676123_11_plen_91_part_00